MPSLVKTSLRHWENRVLIEGVSEEDVLYI